MGMQEIDGIKVWGDPVDQGAFSQIVTCARDAADVAMMADHHKGYAVPIGGVVAYVDKVSPSGVGYDIGCGNKAARLDIPAREVKRKIKKLMDEIYEKISFGMGRNNNEEVDHELFDDEAWKLHPMKTLKQIARNQLGTVGGGNHYVDLFTDELDRVWVGVHFGSRGLGHKTATHFLEMGGAANGMDVPPLVLDVRSSLGSDYLACMELAGKYAYAGRDWVCGKVARILGAKIVEEVHNHHNYCIPGSAKVPTPNGPKRMMDLNTGDSVYAFDEAHGLVETKVINHWHTGKKPIYTIQTRNRAIRVSGTHPLLVIRLGRTPHPDRPWFDKGIGEFEWVPAANVKKGDIIVCASAYYSTSKSIGMDMARFIGAYLGDGWLRHGGTAVSGYSVGLAIGTMEEPHTVKYLRLCERLFPEATWRNNAAGAFGLTCSSKVVHQKIQQFGIGLKSVDKSVPDFIYSVSKEEKLAFLSGYFDSDGSVASSSTSNYGRGAIATVSERLAIGLREMAIACGLQVSKIRQEQRTSNFGEATVYRFSVAADSMAMLDLWHESKKRNLRQTKYGRSEGLQMSKIGYKYLPEGIMAQTVTAITVTDEEDTFDLTVEHPSHSFVCEGVIVHNCWKETHNGQEVYVVRKGATPAFPGQKGFVGGSMGDISVILEGVDSEESKQALYSTVHGAGRVMSRTAARGKVKGGKVITPGAVTPRMMEAWVIRDKGVELRGGGTDESPHCYKRIEEVLAHHANTVKILHTLTPIGVAMAGENIEDPYKD